MKELWIHIDADWSKEKKKVITGIESGFVTFFVENLKILDKIKELAAVRTAIRVKDNILDFDGKADILISDNELPKLKKSKRGFEIDIKERRDERKAINMLKNLEYLVISTNGDIIPLENIISEAQGMSKIIVKITNLKDVKTVLNALEVGADGVLFKPKDNKDVKKIIALMKELEQERIELKTASITNIKPTGIGTRVCVDTCSLMNVGEGALIGSQSNALFLVHSESVENPYVETRPFRINAGAVHAYILLPNGRTKYLSELKAGDEILVVSKDGETRTAIVGRLKVEERPLLLVEAKCDGKRLNTLLQNAETIRLVKENGEPISVAQLKIGDRVLVYISKGGRHFGKRIDETIIEK